METMMIDEWWILPAPDTRNGVPVGQRYMRVLGRGPGRAYRMSARVRAHNGKTFLTWKCYDRDVLPWPDEPEEVPEGELQPVTLGSPHRAYLADLEQRGIVLDVNNPFSFMDDPSIPDERVPVFGDRWD